MPHSHSPSQVAACSDLHLLLAVKTLSALQQRAAIDGPGAEAAVGAGTVAGAGTTGASGAAVGAGAGAAMEAAQRREREVREVLSLRYGAGLSPSVMERLLQGAVAALDRVAL